MCKKRQSCVWVSVFHPSARPAWVCFTNSQIQSYRAGCHSNRLWPELNPSIADRWGHRTRHHRVDHWPHPWVKHKRETNEFIFFLFFFKPRPKYCPRDLRCVWHYWAERNEAIHLNAAGPRCKTRNNGQQLALADARDLTWPGPCVRSHQPMPIKGSESG